jgi:hypothetical protein
VAYTIEGRLYPDKGDLLIHKTQGYIGKYQQDVFTNKDRRHFLVCAIDTGRAIKHLRGHHSERQAIARTNVKRLTIMLLTRRP